MEATSFRKVSFSVPKHCDPKLGGRFGPEKKYLGAPPPQIPRRHPPAPLVPLLKPPPPLLGFSIKMDPPPSWRLGLPLPPPRAEKNKKYPKRPPSKSLRLQIANCKSQLLPQVSQEHCRNIAEKSQNEILIAVFRNRKFQIAMFFALETAKTSRRCPFFQKISLRFLGAAVSNRNVSTFSNRGVFGMLSVFSLHNL